MRPLSEGHIGRRVNDVRAVLLCALKVRVDVIDRDEHACVTWGPCGAGMGRLAGRA
jgi:hypothetical protein